jgi:hypothetical protein
MRKISIKPNEQYEACLHIVMAKKFPGMESVLGFCADICVGTCSGAVLEGHELGYLCKGKIRGPTVVEIILKGKKVRRGMVSGIRQTGGMDRHAKSWA